MDKKIVKTTCAYDCGGRCILKVEVEDGKAVNIRSEKGSGYNKLNACIRGRNNLNKLYHPDRLKYPLKRIGKRGSGKFERITWDEALNIIKENIERITKKYGSKSKYIHYSTGQMGVMNEKDFFRRLTCSYSGGFLDYENSYSTACIAKATPYTYGTALTGSSRDNWLNSKLIILIGHNPAETVFDTNTMYYLLKAKEKGAKIVVIDPRNSDTVRALADEWIPIKPTTDNALFDAMTYVMIKENIYDKDFVDKYCLGFDEEHMPEDIAEDNSLKSYILGLSDGVEKTPKWAEKITGIAAEKIVKLAREYATMKPSALIQGFGSQRHANGEQAVRGATVLASITGNVGKYGGWAAGAAYHAEFAVEGIPYTNRVKEKIPVFTWIDEVEKGNIKFIGNFAGNCLINQHSDINRTIEILKDENLCEFILTTEHFMTSSAEYSDLILPGDDFLERDDIVTSWGVKDFAFFQNKVVEAEYERKLGYEWILELSRRLGVEEEFSQGRNYEDWLKYIVNKTRNRHKDFPTYEEFKKEVLYEKGRDRTYVAFEKQIKDFDKNKFPTPSGKIEIFSKRLYDMRDSEIPAIPKYVKTWEGPEDELTQKYPLQLFGWHSKKSVNSIFNNFNEETMGDLGKHRLWINKEDAEDRNIKDGEKVKVFNNRGELVIEARVTDKIMKGVAAMPQGGWYKADKKGLDKGANINVLTKQHPTALAKGNPQHTNLVEVEKY